MSFKVAEAFRPGAGLELVIAGTGVQKKPGTEPHRTSGIPGNDVGGLGIDGDADAVGMRHIIDLGKVKFVARAT